MKRLGRCVCAFVVLSVGVLLAPLSSSASTRFVHSAEASHADAKAVASCAYARSDPSFTLIDTAPELSFVVRVGESFLVKVPNWGSFKASALNITGPKIVHQVCSFVESHGARVVVTRAAATGTSQLLATVTPASEVFQPRWSGLVTVVASQGSKSSAVHASFCSTASKMLSVTETKVVTEIGSRVPLAKKMSASLRATVRELSLESLSARATSPSQTLASLFERLASAASLATSPTGVQNAMAGFVSGYSLVEAACPADFIVSAIGTANVQFNSFIGTEKFCSAKPLRGWIFYSGAGSALEIDMNVAVWDFPSTLRRVIIEWVNSSGGSGVLGAFDVSRYRRPVPGSLKISVVPTKRAVALELFDPSSSSPFATLESCPVH